MTLFFLFFQIVGMITCGAIALAILGTALLFLVAYTDNLFTACRAWKMSRGAGMNKEDHMSILQFINLVFRFGGAYSLSLRRRRDNAQFPIPMGIFPKKILEEEFEDQ